MTTRKTVWIEAGDGPGHWASNWELGRMSEAEYAARLAATPEARDAASSLYRVGNCVHINPRRATIAPLVIAWSRRGLSMWWVRGRGRQLHLRWWPQ